MATDYLGRTISLGDKYAVIGEVREIDSPRSGLVLVVPGFSPIHCDAADLVHVDALAPRKWGVEFSRTIASASTGFPMLSEAMASTTYGTPVRTKQKVLRVAVVAQHFNGSDPGDWTLRLRKNGSVSDLATFDYEWDASNGNIAVTTGDFSAEVTFDEGDHWGLHTDGPSINLPRVRVWVEVEEAP